MRFPGAPRLIPRGGPRLRLWLPGRTGRLEAERLLRMPGVGGRPYDLTRGIKNIMIVARHTGR